MTGILIRTGNLDMASTEGGPCEDTGNDAIYKPGRETLEKPTLQTSSSQCLASRIVRKYILLCKPPSLWQFGMTTLVD